MKVTDEMTDTTDDTQTTDETLLNIYQQVIRNNEKLNTMIKKLEKSDN